MFSELHMEIKKSAQIVRLWVMQRHEKLDQFESLFGFISVVNLLQFHECTTVCDRYGMIDNVRKTLSVMPTKPCKL